MKLHPAFLALILVGHATSAHGNGTIRFSMDDLETNVVEGVDLRLRLERVGSTAGQVTVDYNLVPLTATVGTDIPSSGGSAVFGNGENRSGIEIILPQDGSPEHTETFEIVLSNPTGGATLGAEKTAFVRIRDDDWSGPHVRHLAHLGDHEIPVHPDPRQKLPSGPDPIGIDVSGITGNVTKVIVKISDLSHERPTDLDLILEGPTGRYCKLMSDYGEGERSGDEPVMHLNLCFDDDGRRPDPEDRLESGSWLPSDHAPGEDLLVDLTAIGASGTDELSVFNGEDPNGTWKLHVIDDFQGIDGNPPYFTGELLGGWELILEYQPPLPPLPTLLHTRDLSPVAVGFFFTGPAGAEWIWERSPDLRTWIFVQTIETTGSLQQVNGNKVAWPDNSFRFRRP